MRRARWWVSGFVLLALVTTACGGSRQDYGTGTTPSVKASKRESGIRRSEPRSVRPTPQPTSGNVTFAVRDRKTNVARAGIPVSFRAETGGRDQTLVTGANGNAAASIAPGIYVAHVVVGCGPSAIVHYGEKGVRFGVVAGKALRIPLEAESRYRFVPSGPIEWNIEPPWARSRTIDFRFRLADDLECGGQEAPNTSFEALRYRVTGAIAIVSAKRRSDGAAGVLVRLRCARGGDATLVLYDPIDTSNAKDLLRFRAPFAPGPWCG